MVLFLAIGLGLGGLCLVPAIVIATFRLRNPCVKSERHKVPVSQNTSLPLNKGLYLGTHNSCHVSPLFSGCFPAHCGPAQWRYSHPPIIEQLEDGIRHVEIDIWFNMDTRHWEIFHHFPDPLVNVGTSVEAALRSISDWSLRNAEHVPVWICFDLKGAYSPLGCQALATVLASSVEDDEHLPDGAIKIAEQLVDRVFGDRAVSTVDLQREAPCLRDAIKEYGWPTQRELAGRFFFTTAACCWGTTAATGRLLKRHRYTEAKEANGGMLDPNVAFYEESNCEKVKELVEAGMCVRCCLFIHDKDHDTRDPGLLDELLPLGLQYIATNDVSIILAAQSFKQDMRVKQDLQDLVKHELVTEGTAWSPAVIQLKSVD